MNTRRLFADAFYAASLHTGHGLRRAKAQHQPRILMYHGVAPDELEQELFEWQLQLLGNEFELVSLAALVERRRAGRLTGEEVAITFDDGVRNHVSVVYPLLQRHRVPATFFVCAGLVDTGRWIWNMELRCRLRLLTDDELRRLAAEVGVSGSEAEALVTHAKRLAVGDRLQFEQRVRERTRQFEPTPGQVDRYAPASWDQLRTLDPELVTIGSHTLNHPILPTLPTEEIDVEIGESRKVLEQRLQREVALFCYPNGDNDLRAQAAVRRHYAAAVTTVPGAVRVSDDICLLPRIPAGRTRGLFMRRLYRHTA
jgi:peptidoglycan/xylan/chitin deacetylase (PgdA/CDA1 family)